MGDIKVKVDLNGVRKKMSAANFKRGQFAMANQAMADMNKFVPRREGYLRNSAHIDSNGSFVVWEMPYARAQFYGPKSHGFKTEKQRRFFFANKDELLKNKGYTTSGTGPRWDLKAKGMYLSSWVDAFKKGAKL